MRELNQLPSGEYYFSIPDDWADLESWKIPHDILRESLKPEVTIYIDLSEVASITSDIFNLLFDLARYAGKQRAKLVFTGANDTLEERIGLLGTSSE